MHSPTGKLLVSPPDFGFVCRISRLLFNIYIRRSTVPSLLGKLLVSHLDFASGNKNQYSSIQHKAFDVQRCLWHFLAFNTKFLVSPPDFGCGFAKMVSHSTPTFAVQRCIRKSILEFIVYFAVQRCIRRWANTGLSS